MNNEIDHSYFRVDVLSTSPRAVQVKLAHSDRELWVPLSLCDIKKAGNGSMLEVEEWFAEKEGMHDE